MSEEIARLLDNNREFAASSELANVDVHDPNYVSVCCCDARVSQQTLFGMRPGRHFTVANIGNSVRTRDSSGDSIVSGSVLYPLLETDPNVLFVVGHTDCGAITAAYRQVADGIVPDRRELTNELELLIPDVEQGLEQIDTDAHGDFETIVRLAEYNVDRQVETLDALVEDFPVVGAICDLHGAYSGTRGAVHVINYRSSRRAREIPEPVRPYFERNLHY
jgi:carbonic anhydrase